MISISALYQLFKESSGVATDTRQIAQNSLFFALKGDTFNANQFAAQALENGANYAIIDEEKYATNARCILVNDVLYTLQKLANYHRNQFAIPVIGLTGSNGKTTNKELLMSVLSKKYSTFATKGNLNNHIGVPLCLLQINASHEVAVIEMGANHQGEIRLLATIAEPTHGFITNIGKAHLEGFGGIEGVEKGKGELFDFLEQSGGTVFVNERNEVINRMANERSFNQKIMYGNDLVMEQESPEIWLQIATESTIYKTHLSGNYNFENIQNAFAIGTYFGVAATDCCEALAAYNPTNNRSQVLEKETNTLYLDAYNANPSSMEASILNFMKLVTEKQKVVILGDMFELGEASETEHAQLGKLVKEGNFATVVLYGEHMKHALPHLPQAYYFTDKFSLHNWLQDKAFQHSCILIKGSRGVGLESTLTFL